MPCPPLVPISIIPPVSQGGGPVLWINGSQIARLNAPLNPSWLVYDGSTSKWADGSDQLPIYIPALAEIPPDNFAYIVGISNTGQLGKSQNGATPIANNIYAGAAGEIVYQSNFSTTSFVPVGNPSQILTSNGANAPIWIDQSSISAGTFSGNLEGDVTGGQTNTTVSKVNNGSIPINKTIVGTNSLGQFVDASTETLTNNISGNAATATTAVTATSAINIDGGTSGALPYQVSGGSTTFLAQGTSGQVLSCNGTGGLGWITNSTTSVSANNLNGGDGGYIPYQSSVNTTLFVTAGSSGQLFTSGGTGTPTWQTPSALTVGKATNIAGGAAGNVVYQTASDTTGFTAVGTTGQVLTSAGTGSPIWSSQSSLSVGSATTSVTATNLANGAAGKIPYQTGSGSTDFTAVGTTGQVLTSAGTSSPSWASQSTLSVGSSTTATNLANGGAGQVPYNTGSGATSFLAAGTSGQFLKSNGTSAPSWGNPKVAWLIKNTTYTASAGEYIAANTSSGAWTLSLPASPSTGDAINIIDAANYWATNNLTVSPNGSTIQGVSQNLICNTSNKLVIMFYNGSTWEVNV
jgi:hypothetical protein